MIGGMHQRSGQIGDIEQVFSLKQKKKGNADGC
jgi:hypothetical protein